MTSSYLSSIAGDDSPFKSARFRRTLAFSWIVFLTLSVAYCYAYAWVVDGPYTAKLMDALQCVSYDWLIWVFVSPVLIARSCRYSFANSERWRSLLGLLLTTTLIVGSFRFLLESLTGELTITEVALIYTPRYFFVSAFILAGALLYRSLEARMDAVSDAPIPLTDETRSADHLIVLKGAAKVVLPIKEIICLSASGNYLDIHTRTHSYLLRGTIKGLEERLASHQFIRVHRSHLVRLDAIESASRGSLEVRLINGKKLRLGLSYLHHLPHFS